ncbi:MAG: nucleoside recognition domain-containing protein [Bacteroidota bacterium]
MLNYIWAGLIIFSLVFALASDVRDMARDTYRNEMPLPVTLRFPSGYEADARSQPVQVRLDPDTVQVRYGLDSPPTLSPTFAGRLTRSQGGLELRFAEGASLPEPLATIQARTSPRNQDLRGRPGLLPTAGDTLIQSSVTFETVRFVKLNAITQAAIDFAETAVTLALGLIGVLALWMGLLKIAEASGLLYALIRVTQPLLRPLFPSIPKDHPALGMIVLNLSANMLGLGNAATPLGIKAMEELQTLNPSEDTATNDMVMLLAMNTASVQLVPPALLVAIMGTEVNRLFFSILIVTGLSLTVAIVTARLLSRRPKHRATDPLQQAPPPPTSPDPDSAA